jgi:hypothetical protein
LARLTVKTLKREPIPPAMMMARVFISNLCSLPKTFRNGT